MLRKSMWAAGIAAVTAALLAFSATPAMAQRHGGGGGFHGGGAHVSGFHGGAAHVSGFHGGVAHVNGFHGGVAHVNSFRGRGFNGWGGYGVGLYGYGWPGYYAYDYPYYGGYDSPYYGSTYYSDYYYPSNTTVLEPAPSTSYYYNPSVNTVPSNSGVSSDAMKATIGVHVPANAQVWFDGAATQQTGEWREFSSPPLDAGRTFHYDIRAQWLDNGQMIDQTRRVDVRAGSLTNVDFLRPAPTASPVNVIRTNPVAPIPLTTNSTTNPNLPRNP